MGHGRRLQWHTLIYRVVIYLEGVSTEAQKVPITIMVVSTKIQGGHFPTDSEKLYCFSELAG